MFNKRITALKHYFGIFEPKDWQTVTPDMIMRQDGVGEKLLNYLRLLLAQRGLTLKDDKTPEYWSKHLQELRICDTLGDDEDGLDRGELFPWTVFIDTAEQTPFTFQGFAKDFNVNNNPWIIPTQPASLGRYPDSLGDYTLDVCVNRCHVERKSKEDAHGTFLGFKRRGEDSGRRDRFERELENLSKIQAGLVVVECSFSELIGDAPTTPNRSAAENAVTLETTIMAWQQDYKVAWAFCDSRRHAERCTLRWLYRFARNEAKQRKQDERKQLSFI